MSTNRSKRLQRKSQGLLLIHCLVFLSMGCQPQLRVSDEIWRQYPTLEVAGWSTEQPQPHFLDEIWGQYLSSEEAGWSTQQTQTLFPDEIWMQYASPEEAGWSTEQLVESKAYADSIGSAAFMLVHDGAVVTTHGDIGRRYMCHSVRKSFPPVQFTLPHEVPT